MKDSKTDYFLVKNDVTSQALHSREIIADQKRQLFRQNFTRDKKSYFALNHADSFIIVIRHSDKTLLVYAIRIRCELELKFARRDFPMKLFRIKNMLRLFVTLS